MKDGKIPGFKPCPNCKTFSACRSMGAAGKCMSQSAKKKLKPASKKRTS